MTEPPTLDATFRRINAEHLARSFPPGSANHRHRLEFSLGRLREGRRAVGYLARRYPQVLGALADAGEPAPEDGVGGSAGGAPDEVEGLEGMVSVRPDAPAVLDLGCGNGGMLLPFAAAGARAVGLDLDPRPEIGAVARAEGLAVETVAGRGEELPFADATFDLVLFVETVEHLEVPRQTGREIVRVLKPGGLCYVTTPPRLRFLLGRDPHYGLPGLLLLPDRLQRLLFERLLRRGEPYAVTHTYWSVAGVLGTLPGLRLAEVTSKNWAGPLRRLDWDWIVARKG